MGAGKPVAVVTGASSGIGAATVRALTDVGYSTVAAARRLDRCQALADEVGGEALELDVTDPSSVDRLAGALDEVDVIVHSAGGALGLDPVVAGDDEHWTEMYEANVLGVVRVSRALMPALLSGAPGHIVILGSVAGVEAYPGGGGYTAAKHAVHAVAKTLRLELLEHGVRVTEIAPGMVETEFSLVRFGGDRDRADAVYHGVEPLTATDVAELITFAVTRPSHVTIDYMGVKPTAQATATVVNRER